MTTRGPESFQHAVYRIALMLLGAAVLGLTGWILSQGERVSALETSDRGLAQQIENVRQNTQDIKQDVRDIHQYLLDGVKPRQH